MLLLPSPPEKKVLKFKYSSWSRTRRLNNPSGMLLAGVDWAHTIESGFYTSILVSAATLIKHGSLPSFQFSSSLLLQCTLMYSSLFLLSDWETKSYCNTESDNLSHFDLEAWRFQLKCGIWSLHTGLFTGKSFFFFNWCLKPGVIGVFVIMQVCLCSISSSLAFQLSIYGKKGEMPKERNTEPWV